MTTRGNKWDKDYMCRYEIPYDFFIKYQVYEIFSDDKGKYVIDDFGHKWYECDEFDWF